MSLRIVQIPWHPRYSYAIAGLKINGKRTRRYFKTAAAAKAELERLKIKAYRQGQAGLDIPDQLRSMAVDCSRQLEPYGKTIAEATGHFLRHLADAESAPVAALVDDYLRARQRAGLSARHLRDISARLVRFRKDFGARPVRTIGAQEVEDWLFGEGEVLSPQTVFNRRGILHAFFGWLLRQKAIEYNPVAAIAKPKVVRGAPPIWTPEDLEKLLRAAPPELVPVLAIGAFGGLRTSELLRLNWSEIALERRFIEVKADKTKTARRRLVKIEANLAQWLEPFAGRTGPVLAMSERAYHAAASRLCGALGLKWPENGLRHSFASYHLAHFRNAAATALELGHINAHVTFAHYRELVTPEQAEAYWEIAP
jgi:integrase